MVGGTVESGVVKQNRNAVSREPNIQLERIGAMS